MLTNFDLSNRKSIILPKDSLAMVLDQVLEYQFRKFNIKNVAKYEDNDKYIKLLKNAVLSYFYSEFTVKDRPIRILNKYNIRFNKSFAETIALILLANQVDLDLILYFDGAESITVYEQILDDVSLQFITRVINHLNLDQFFINPYMEYNIDHSFNAIIITEEIDYRIRRYIEAVSNGIIAE